MSGPAGPLAWQDAFASAPLPVTTSWTGAFPSLSFGSYGPSVATDFAWNCRGPASNPSLGPSNVSAPALQAVLSLNASISSQAELDAWLASLLDNTTGGLNGSLVDVAGELPTLGLNAVVTAALANETWASSGVFGDTISIATTTFVALGGGPHPSFSFSFLSIFLGLWNAVSGAFTAFVGAIADGIEGLAGAIWNAALAVAAYFDHLVQGLAKLAEAAVSAAVGALEAYC